MRPTIFFFIPVFNEQETVGILLYRISLLMKALRFEYQVILTLDGCTDESPAVVAQYLAGIPLRVIDHARRQGYGPSLLEALRIVERESENPKRDFFLVLDGDFATDLVCLEEMAQQIDRNVDLYCADSFTESRVKRCRRLAQWLVRRILRFRGREPQVGTADLLTTLRGCRVHLLSRASAELERLGELGKAAPQAASLLFFLALLPFCRKFLEVRVKHRRIARRRSRFAPLSLARFLFFTQLLPVLPASARAVAESRRSADPGRRSDRRSIPAAAPAAAQSAGEPPADKPASRSSRRRRKRKTAAEKATQNVAGQPQQQKTSEKSQTQSGRGTKKPQEKQPAAAPDTASPEGAEERKPRSRRRRRRRPANKDGQGSSNSGDKES